MSIAMSATGSGLAGLRLIAEQSETGNDALMPSVQVLANWNGDGVTFTDESSYVRAVTVQRGRAQINDVVQAGRATVRLKNQDGRFSPWNPLSPLYPAIVGGRLVKITASYRGVVYAEYAGYTMEGDHQTLLSAPAELQLQLIDAFDRFRLTSAEEELQQNVTLGAVIAAILAAAGWTGGTTLDSGRTVPLYGPTTNNVLQELQLAASHDLPGRVWIDKSGGVQFESSTRRLSTPVAHVITSVERMQQLQFRSQDLYAEVTAQYGSYTWGTAGQVYQGQAALPLFPGENTITDLFSVPGVQAIQAPVPGTDYTVLDQPSPPVIAPPGTEGVPPPWQPVDVTNNVLMDGLVPSTVSNAFTLKLYNGLPYTAYLQQLTLRGTPLVQQPNPRTVSSQPTTPLVVGQTLTPSFPWLQDDAAVATWVQTVARALGTQHPRLQVQLVGKTPALMHSILAAELSDRVLLQDVWGDIDFRPFIGGPLESAVPFEAPTTRAPDGTYDGTTYDASGYAQLSPWLSGLNTQFFIEGIQLTIQPGQIPTAVWTLFDAVQGSVT